jgi:hypothetical protein
MIRYDFISLTVDNEVEVAFSASPKQKTRIIAECCLSADCCDKILTGSHNFR